MKQLVIIGAGGMGRSIYSIAKNDVGYQRDFEIKGFIDDNAHALDGFEGYPTFLGSIQDYQIEQEDVFVCSIGDVRTKKKVCDYLASKGAVFQTLIHHTAIVYDGARIGSGCVISEYASIGADCMIGENTLIQSFAIVGHDCRIGNYVRIDTHVTCVGGIEVKDGATIHTSSVINHNVVVGEGATVGALSFVIRKVKPYTTVWGNPAKLLV